MTNKNNDEVIVFDIEVSPSKGYFWANPWQASIIKVIEEGQILTIAWQSLRKENGEWKVKGPVKSLGHWQDPKYKKGILNDRWLVQEFAKVLEKVRIAIGQNSDQFDIKWVQGRMFVHGIKPTSPFKSFDTKKISKANFNFITNKLDDLAKRRKIGEKLKHEGFDMWEGVMAGDERDCKKMIAYNKHDVKITSLLWIDMLPWITRDKIHWNNKKQCPVCYGYNTQNRGSQPIKTDNGKKEEVKRHFCKDCAISGQENSGWFNGDRIINRV